MIIENPPPPNSRLDGLVKASEVVHAPGSAAVTPCPYADPPPPPPPPKLPLRILMWNILELGGGFSRPSERPDYVIDSYASLIESLNIDICVILGVTRTVGKIPVRQEGDNPCLIMEDGPIDSGPAEVQRILEKLKSRDTAGNWEAQFFKPENEHVYHFGATTCFLHRTSKGIRFSKFDLADSKSNHGAGLTGKLLCAAFELPEHEAAAFHIAAPLGVPPHQRPLARKPDPGPESALRATGPLPKPCIVGVSSPNDLLNPKWKFHEFKASVQATYLRPGREGTILQQEFWQKSISNNDRLLSNFLAVDIANVSLQDDEMYWSAMDKPKHAETAEEVSGILADVFLLSNGPQGTPSAVIDEIRIVDLIAAAIPAEKLGQIRQSAAPADAAQALPSEDSVLAAQRRARRNQTVSGPQPEENAANELADCHYFSLALSEHWPVVAQLRFNS